MSKLNILRYVSMVGVTLFFANGLNAQDYSVYDDEIKEGKSVEKISTASVSTVTGDQLYEAQTSNLSNSFVGLFSGMSVIQGNGAPGYDNAKWTIHGIGSYGVGSWNTAKIFVDGFEVNSEYLVSLSPSDIESVSVLKDAAALALYGERGANGVILVTTKRGVEGQATVTANLRYGLQTPGRINKPLGSYDFANLYNQAVSNDNGMEWSPVYSGTQLDAYRNGTGIDVDWYDEVLKNTGSYVDSDVILNGGAKNARYNVSLGYLNNSGLLNVQNTDKTKNVGYEKYNLRANLDFNILKIFEVKVDIGARIELKKRPNYEISSLFGNLAKYPSNIYNVYDDAEAGNYSGTAIYPDNPFASIRALGWQSMKARSLQGNFSVKERLDMIAEGLYLQEAFSFYSYTLSAYSKTANYARWHEGATTTTDETTTITASGYGSNGMQDWKQGKVTLGYDNVFGKHTVSGVANWEISAYKGDGYFSYKYNNLNLNALAHYDYDGRYAVELAMSTYGNDAYAPGHRWGFYPAASFAWVASNESFLKYSDAVDYLKFRASVGLSGASDSGATAVLSSFSSNGRFLFKDYYTYSYIGSFYTGKDSGTWQTSLVTMFILNEDAHAEKSLKYNLGVDASLFKGLDITFDAFLDKRHDILTLDNSLMGYYGKQFYFSNVGKMTNKGFDLSASWTRKSGDFSYNLNGMVSFNRNKIDYMAEVATANDFSAMTGRPYGSVIGLEADGFYGIEDFDSDGNLNPSLPVPAFGSVQPGDVKYKDLDGNNVVDQNDVTKIGKSVFPEWYYSFGGRFGYKGFDMAIMFQGIGGASMNLLDNWNQTVAFVNNGNAYELAKGAWAYYPTEGIDTRNTATYPRLTTQSNSNNYRASSLWIRNADYLKLRNLEFGYSFNGNKVREAGIEKLRVFVSGHNLFTISSLLRDDNLDPENAFGGYPVIRSFNAGVTLTF